MTIKFKSINLNNEIKEWQYKSKEEIEKEWNNGWNVPENDNEVFYIEIDGIKKDVPNGFLFEDILMMVGIEIW